MEKVDNDKVYDILREAVTAEIEAVPDGEWALVQKHALVYYEPDTILYQNPLYFIQIVTATDNSYEHRLGTGFFFQAQPLDSIRRYKETRKEYDLYTKLWKKEQDAPDYPILGAFLISDEERENIWDYI